MGVCFQLLESDKAQQLPGLLLMQSPPMRIPPSAQQKEQMRQIEARDCVFTADYYSYLSSIADFSGCEYLLRPLDRDLSGFPKMYVFMGEYETAAAYLPELKEKCAADGAELILETGPQMMHNWCLLGNTPEAGKVRRSFYEILTSHT
jgi:acetyl esterase/lipase